MNLTKSQITLFLNKITKRKEQENEFQKALHGIKPEQKGLNVAGAIPIEDIIDGSNTNLKM